MYESTQPNYRATTENATHANARSKFEPATVGQSLPLLRRQNKNAALCYQSGIQERTELSALFQANAGKNGNLYQRFFSDCF